MSRRRNGRIARTVFSLLLAGVVVAGCGFHLQGSSPLPDSIAAMHVSYSDAYRVGDPPLVDALRQRLREQGLLGAVDSPAQLDIQRIDNRQRIVSVSPVDGRVAEYQLTTEVRFDYSVKGATQLSGETMSITRDYSFDDTERLAAESERRDLLTGMHRALANRIFMRIAGVNDKLAVTAARDGS